MQVLDLPAGACKCYALQQDTARRPDKSIRPSRPQPPPPGQAVRFRSAASTPAAPPAAPPLAPSLLARSWPSEAFAAAAAAGGATTTAGALRGGDHIVGSGEPAQGTQRRRRRRRRRRRHAADVRRKDQSTKPGFCCTATPNAGAPNIAAATTARRCRARGGRSGGGAGPRRRRGSFAFRIGYSGSQLAWAGHVRMQACNGTANGQKIKRSRLQTIDRAFGSADKLPANNLVRTRPESSPHPRGARWPMPLSTTPRPLAPCAARASLVLTRRCSRPSSNRNSRGSHNASRPACVGVGPLRGFVAGVTDTHVPAVTPRSAARSASSSAARRPRATASCPARHSQRLSNGRLRWKAPWHGFPRAAWAALPYGR
eukprot:365285-Chlamydomonas_euryale.AAC.4